MSDFRSSWARALLGSASGVAVAMALTAGVAYAQGDGAAAPAATPPAQPVAGGALETITVTAEFRAANLQDTPIAITAVNAAMLEARSQTNIAQVAAQTPNVSLRPAGSAFGNSLVAFIRGVGQTDFNFSTEPGVGMYVDDVYYSTITGNVLDLLDLNRVEILRGPQGTLAGRNAIGGAIKLYTRQPDGSDDGFVETTYGKFDRIDFRGAAGLTIVEDKLFARIAGASRTRDGYIQRLDYACANNSPDFGTAGGVPTYSNNAGCKLGTEGGQSYTSGRVSLRWVAADNFEINVAGDFTNDDSEAAPGLLIHAQDHSLSSIISGGQGSLVPIYYDNDGDHLFTPGVDVPYDNRFATGGTYTNYATYIDDGRSTPSDCNSPAPFPVGQFAGCELAQFKPYVVPPINHLKAWGVSANINWQLTDTLSLLSVSSYRYYDNSFAEDTDGSPLAVQQLLQRLVHRQWSQELRLNGSMFEDFIDWTFGGFYMDQSGFEDARVDLPYVGFDFIHGPDLTPSTNQALYAHVTAHPFEKLDISVGGRYSKDEKSYTFHRHTPGGDEPLPPVAPPFFGAGNPPDSGVAGLNGLSTTYSSERWDYRVAADYDITDDLMVYAQMATGYKGGGNNARPFFPSQLNVFQPETLTSYEGGFKSTWNDMLRLNAAGFWNIYKSIQLPATTCTWAPPGQQNPCASQNNIGDAHVWGVEVEAELHPTENFEIDASYSYLNFEYQRIATLADGVTPASSVTLSMITPYTPENKWSVGAQYEIAMPSGLGSLTPRVDVNYTSEVFGSATNDAHNFIDGYTLANARVTWRSEDEQWQAAAEVTNLTDEYYYVTIFDLEDGQAGYTHGQPGRPLEWAVTVKRKF